MLNEEKERYALHITGPKKNDTQKRPCELEKILSRRIDEEQFMLYDKTPPHTKNGGHWIFMR